MVHEGQLQPLTPVDFREGERLTVTVHSGPKIIPPTSSMQDWIKYGHRISDEDAKAMQEAIDEAFGQIDPDE